MAIFSTVKGTIIILIIFAFCAIAFGFVKGAIAQRKINKEERAQKAEERRAEEQRQEEIKQLEIERAEKKAAKKAEWKKQNMKPKVKRLGENEEE